MKYADHLEYQDFTSPVCFRVEPVNDVDALIPTYGITQDVFVDKYGMKRGDDFDVALFVNESKAEFAFESASHNKEDVIEDVRELISKYNEPPEKLDAEERKDYEEMNVEITDVTEI